MTLVKMMWAVGAISALALGMGAEACATSNAASGTDSGTGGSSGPGCTTLGPCCTSLTGTNQTDCQMLVADGNAANCSTFLAQAMMNGSCATTGTGSGTGVVVLPGSSTGTGTSSATSTSSSTASGSDAAVDTGTGTDAGSDAGSGSGSSSSSSSSGSGSSSSSSSHSSSSSGSAGIPTTCSEAYGNIGCCGSDGNEYYCATGSSTVTMTACTGTKVCTWDTSAGYYHCGTGTMMADPSGTNPINCQ